MSSLPQRFRVRMEVPRIGGWREWGAVAGDFEGRLAAQESRSVTGPRIESETRRGRDYVRVRVAVTVGAPDLAQALVTAWGVFRKAAGQDAAAWDMASASAEVRPAGNALREDGLLCLAAMGPLSRPDA